MKEILDEQNKSLHSSDATQAFMLCISSGLSQRIFLSLRRAARKALTNVVVSITKNCGFKRFAQFPQFGAFAFGQRHNGKHSVWLLPSKLKPCGYIL